MTPYNQFVRDYMNVMSSARSLPLGGFPSLPRPALAPDAPVALIFAPHPDDECIVGALALRLLRDMKMRVIDVAVTQGSNKERQAPRFQELTNACRFLGFEVVATQPGGLEKIRPATRHDAPAHWAVAVDVIAAILRARRPKIVFAPHEADWNTAHMGTHHLVMDALAKAGPELTCYIVETEYWQAMSAPNLMSEVGPELLADLIAALTFHVEEVRRNPYHIGLPAWMQDNVRRGAEIVGGQGGAAPDYRFATLYRVLRWNGRTAEPAWQGGKFLAAGEDIRSLFLRA